MVKCTTTGTVPTSGRGGTAAATTQNEQTAEQHSTLEQQRPWRLDHPAWCLAWTVWPASTITCPLMINHTQRAGSCWSHVAHFKRVIVETGKAIRAWNLTSFNGSAVNVRRALLIFVKKLKASKSSVQFSSVQFSSVYCVNRGWQNAAVQRDKIICIN